MKSPRTVYFVQAGNLFGVNAHLPYAAGCVAAYAWNNPLIRENYRLGHFTFLRTPIDQVIEFFDQPYMVAFSNYLWNFEYHKALARTVKERWPDCLILFGGHQIYNNSSRQLDEYPFVDYLVHKAGEVPFEKLLLALLQDTDLSGVPSISYRDVQGDLQRTKEAPCKSCDYPSPYLTGIFDSLFVQYPSILFSMTLETNRGCPHSCTYCDWGVTRQTFLCVSMERITAEIKWAALHKIEFIICADANFGILERDEAIVDYLVESKLRSGYPMKFNAQFTKNSSETVLRLNQKLSRHGMSNGATFSLQSLSPVVLKNIGRINLGYGRLHELISLNNKAGIPVYTELIMALPGETLDSFARGIGTLLAAGMHGVIEVYPCELLPNAEMSTPAYIEKHGIEGIRVRQTQRHGSPKNNDEIPEYSNFVCKTNTMPVKDWITAYLFTTVVQGCHAFGLLSCFAVYLYFDRQVPYERFYFDLIEIAKAKPTSLVGELLSFIEKQYEALAQGNGECLVCYDPRFGELTWPLGAILFLRAAFESERFFQELPSFLLRYGIEEELLAQLIRYQRTTLLLPEAPPARAVFEYDFPKFFAAAFAGQPLPLEKKRASLLFPEQTKVMGWVEYARDYVWYGRRKGMARKGYEVVYE